MSYLLTRTLKIEKKPSKTPQANLRVTASGITLRQAFQVFRKAIIIGDDTSNLCFAPEGLPGGRMWRLQAVILMILYRPALMVLS